MRPRSWPLLRVVRCDEARRQSRYSAEWLTCDRGAVLDLSATGVRLLWLGGPLPENGAAVRLKLAWPQGQVMLRARAVWTRKAGPRRFVVGLEFQTRGVRAAGALRELLRLCVKHRVEAKGQHNAA